MNRREFFGGAALVAAGSVLPLSQTPLPPQGQWVSRIPGRNFTPEDQQILLERLRDISSPIMLNGEYEVEFVEFPKGTT
jgi:hypothetical protein